MRPLLALLVTVALSAGCASHKTAQLTELGGATPTANPGQCLRDVSLVYDLKDYSHPYAELTVRNDCDRAVLATLEWDGGLGVQRQYNVIIYPNTSLDTRLTLNLQDTKSLHMRVVEAQWK